MTNILVCDDELEPFKRTKSKLDPLPKVKVQGLVKDDLRQRIKALFEEASVLLSNQAGVHAKDSIARAAFEEVDVAILDNNLWALNLDGVRLTAESLMGYLRAFTDIPYIISLNKNPDVDFDLRYMVGDHQTHADLALNTNHLSCGMLWRNRLDETTLGTDVFAPSYWPNIREVSGLRRRLVKIIEGHLHSPFLEVLNFPEGYSDVLSRHAKGVISPSETTDQDLRTVSCIDFFGKSCRSLPPREIKILHDRALGDDLHARSSVARFVAADMDKWIRRLVLGPQDVLIDLPHLLARMPFLLGGDAARLDGWNTALRKHDFVRKDGSRTVSDRTKELIDEARYAPPGMYSRWPCFWWHRLRDNEELNQLFFDCRDDWADVVFCEDLSKFVEVTKEEQLDDLRIADGPTQFEAEFAGPWSRRYVRVLQGFQYSPRSRLAI